MDKSWFDFKRQLENHGRVTVVLQRKVMRIRVTTGNWNEYVLFLTVLVHWGKLSAGQCQCLFL